MRPVAVTGIGIVSAAGRGAAAAREAILEGRSCLGPLGRLRSPRCGGFPVAEAREVPAGADPSRTVALGRLALDEAFESAGLDRGDLGTAGIAAGTCVGGMAETEGAVEEVLAGRSPDPAVWRRHECGRLAAALADGAGLEGPALTVSNACSSGAQAIAMAADLIDAGEAGIMLAGGADALCLLTLNGFASLLAMDPAGCRPFDRNRKGMSLGEGAAFLVLEDRDHALARGAPLLASIAGWGNTCDAHHPTAPDPEGKGIEAAVAAALGMAGLAPADVDYVNAHGTGTPDNDRAEGRALARIFAGAVPPISSTKGVFGHTLAATGAIEAALCVLAIRDGFLPGTCRLADPDPECGIVPLGASRPGRPRAILSNSFGFGGNNTVLCITAPDRRP